MSLSLRRAPLTIALSSLACSSVGPPTIPRDRFDYSEAISESWREQMLMSIIKLRYVEMPMFVEVSSVNNQYSLETSVNGGVVRGDPTVNSVGGSGTFSDRPTITYSPIVGSKFTTNLMTPLPPSAVLWLIESGWDADWLLRICVKTVNGIHNRGIVGRTEAEPEFEELLDLLMDLQESDAVGMQVAGTHADQAIAMLIRHPSGEDHAPMGVRLRELLGISQDATRFKVIYGANASNDTEIAILTRSLYEILYELGLQIEVPEGHRLEGRTLPDDLAEGDVKNRMITVHHGASPSDDAFVSVRYRDTWFWIDDQTSCRSAPSPS